VNLFNAQSIVVVHRSWRYWGWTDQAISVDWKNNLTSVPLGLRFGNVTKLFGSRPVKMELGFYYTLNNKGRDNTFGVNHNAASTNEEFNYPGVHGNTDKTVEIRMSSTGSVAGEAPLMFGTPGATGVWAPENTREEIFDAIKRKETYGTFGPLIRLRFFGGWGYDEGLVKSSDLVKKAYAGGAPMGGDLPTRPEGAKAPTFAVWAMKDPDSGNLDRIQIVKGWYKNGYGWEKIYNVAWSDGRKLDDQGKLPPVGNTVDVANASYTNSIGDNQLMAVRTDCIACVMSMP
jgi:hypothetical protein